MRPKAPQQTTKRPDRHPRIDLIIPGLGAGSGRQRDRFQASAETSKPYQVELRKNMVRDLGSRLLHELLRARMAGRFSTTELWNAYRQGDVALTRLLEHARTRPLAPLVDEYVAHATIRSIDSVAQYLSRFLSFLGPSATTADITPVNVERFLASLTKLVGQRTSRGLDGDTGKPVSPATQNRYKAAIAVLCTYLVNTGHLERNPIAAGRVKRRKEARGRMPDWTPNEYRAYFTAVDERRPEFALIYRLLLWSGADVGEIVGQPGIPGLTVRQCLLSRDLPRLRLRRHKTSTPERLVPIPRDVAESLQAHILAERLGNDDLVFDPTRYPRRSVETTHLAVTSAIGRPDLRLKDFRHLCAISWRRQGVDLITIRDRLGHTNLNTTAIYAAYGPCDLTEAAPVEQAYSQFAATPEQPAEPVEERAEENATAHSVPERPTMVRAGAGKPLNGND